MIKVCIFNKSNNVSTAALTFCDLEHRAFSESLQEKRDNIWPCAASAADQRRIILATRRLTKV